jgi:hypothetical protein
VEYDKDGRPYLPPTLVVNVLAAHRLVHARLSGNQLAWKWLADVYLPLSDVTEELMTSDVPSKVRKVQSVKKKYNNIPMPASVSNLETEAQFITVMSKVKQYYYGGESMT